MLIHNISHHNESNWTAVWWIAAICRHFRIIIGLIRLNKISFTPPHKQRETKCLDKCNVTVPPAAPATFYMKLPL